MRTSAQADANEQKRENRMLFTVILQRTRTVEIRANANANAKTAATDFDLSCKRFIPLLNEFQPADLSRNGRALAAVLHLTT